MNWTYVLIAHGTIASIDDLPEFLLEIRRGRPVSRELIEEMRHRYALIGHSPLLEHTRAQAVALAQLSGRACRVAMRLWEPRLLDVLADLNAGDGVCLVPIAPFSVNIYAESARKLLGTLPVQARPQFTSVAPWGNHSSLISAHVEQIRRSVESAFASLSDAKLEIILTAHSLPSFIIRGGDRYEEQFKDCARLVASQLSTPVSICYQSQGGDGGEWLGPTLSSQLNEAAQRGVQHIVVAPIGFLTEHIETLYDLDIEAKAQACSLGMKFTRVPTLGTASGLIQTLAEVAEQAVLGAAD